MLLYLLVLVVMLAVGLVLVFNVFFNVQYIVVRGNTRYDDDQVIEASGVLIGDNLFRLDMGQIEQTLYERYSYFDAVEVYRELPESLIIEVQMAQPIGAIEQSDGYLLYSASGRVLEEKAKLTEDLVVIKGLPDLGIEVGKTLDWQGDERLNMVRILGEAAQTAEFTLTGEVLLQDQYDIVLKPSEDLTIGLGSEAEMEYKLRLVKKVLEEELGTDFTGTIDASSPPYVRARAKQEETSLPSTDPTEEDPQEGTEEDEPAQESEKEEVTG